MKKTDDEWRRELTPEQFHVLRKHGTEPPGSSALNAEKREGRFTCAGCGQPLFIAGTKFESGTGWPSFFRPLEGAVGTTTDGSHFMTRTEVHCARCEGHLGHVFPDGPAPTGQRFCMNGVALKFEPGEDQELTRSRGDARVAPTPDKIAGSRLTPDRAIACSALNISCSSSPAACC